jgi:hypothetical protein
MLLSRSVWLRLRLIRRAHDPNAELGLQEARIAFLAIGGVSFAAQARKNKSLDRRRD